MSVGLSNRHQRRSARRWLVIVSTLLLVLSACRSTATIDLTNAPEPAQATPSEVPTAASEDPGTTSSEPEETIEADPETTTATTDTTEEPDTSDDETTTSDESTEDPAVASSTPRFELQGELPLSTDEVNALVEYVEESTARPFLRPPKIVAQPGDVFFESVQEDIDDFEEDAEVDIRTLQALGLTDKGVAEIVGAFVSLMASPAGVQGYYDPEVDQLFVPTDALPGGEFSGLLVHELTHALDAQYVDLNVFDDLIETADETGNYEPAAALSAVVEGRARLIQNRWLEANGVTPAEPDDLSIYETVPASMLLAISIPYEFGQQFIDVNGGASETWDLLEEPPASSEVFIIPRADVATQPIVDVPTPAADGPILNETTYGAQDIFVWLLGESLEPDPALIFPAFAAVDGWAGGRSVLWGDEATSCVRIAIAGDSPRDLAEIQDVVEAWAAASTERSVSVANDLVTVTGCAPYVP